MSVIDEIKQKLDIAEVVGQYATLKKAGRNLTAICPFHSEKHPSFFVYPEQQSWHCFGACNTGGDVFAFVMKKENMDFGEALKLLADRAGVTLPARYDGGGREEEKKPFFAANEAAALYYHNLLLNSPAAAGAKSYVEKRGINQQTIEDFQLGFSVDSYDALKLYLLEKGHDEKTLIAAGLLYEDERHKTSDRFRGKLMIPIRDAKGRVTGFGARVLDNSEPKYKNSPDSPTFSKSATLYGIDRAAAAIRKLDFAIIMEGYMDVIMAHQCGVTNAVACMGTAITETQVNILKRLSKNLLLSLDADAAGEEAMLRTVAYENILNAEMRVIRLPQGKDPDEVMLEDVTKWNGFVKDSIPLVDFLFEKTTAGLDLATARGKTTAVDNLLSVIAAINDPIRQAHYLQKLAALVNVDMNTIQASLVRLKPSPVRGKTVSKPVNVPRPITSSREEYCLAFLLQYPQLREFQANISPDYFSHTINREIFLAYQSVKDVQELKNSLDPALQEHLDVIMNKELPTARNNLDSRLNDCVMELRKTYLRNMAARRAEAADVEVDLEEGVKIGSQLKELDADRVKKRQSSYGKLRR
ncbi:MAG: DNA primase [Dehalococcoidales bacterium]|nr:DNA primase [Dehalococcoidales bacterium]